MEMQLPDIYATMDEWNGRKWRTIKDYFCRFLKMSETLIDACAYDVDRPSCSGDKSSDGLSFQYEWIVKVSERSIGSEAVILNVSPAFSTAFNGVQFTWTLRLSDDCIAPDCADASSNGVNVFLYYKDGPAQDINILDAGITIADNEGQTVFTNLRIADDEFTRGSGWAVKTTVEQMQKLTRFMQTNINNTVRITVDIRMDERAFSPLCYLPSVDHASCRLEAECHKYLKEVETNKILVPDLDLVLNDPDIFAVHRQIFLHGCKEVDRRLNGSSDAKQVTNVFAHVYFNKCIMPGVECFEDFMEVIEGSRNHHIPALTREAERFICGELIACSGELNFAKKMLLLAQRYQLPVLKMMCVGILTDRIVEHSNKFERINTIGDEMRKLVRQITFSDDQYSTDKADSDSLVDSVVEELKMLTKRIRKVSISSI
ncbi:hypothetical protein Tcan_02610 [Toxocara canis]|uniref:Uncharacterized protein n=1 Tax=Toxocara canis TaxID=6265 RepID=A0A0B2W5R4_TOXCA|nr:hypothetical protein Tcan_02610 [Toxocara canis]